MSEEKILPRHIQREGLKRRLVIAADQVPDALISDGVAEFALTLRHDGGIRVRGNIKGTVTRACVVTGEPVSEAFACRTAVDYLPTYQPKRDNDGFITLPETGDSGADAEPLPPEGISLQALIREEIVLNLDPYPRKAGLGGDIADE